MAITAKVRNKQIDTGKVLHALVQGENASGNITFQIIGEEELVEDFASTYFYLLYTRPSDETPNVLLLTNKQLDNDVISVTFKPTSYFTAQDGTVQIQIMATDTEGLSIDSETGTISGSVIWQTFPGAMFVHASQLTGTETIIEENVLTQYLAGMQELYSQTEDAEGDAADYAQLAKAWASKTNGAVEGGDMSAKYYAGTADSRAKEAEGYAVGTVSGSPSATFAGKNAKELASDAQDWAKGTRSDGKTPSHTSDSAKAYAESAADSAAIVSAHATAIDAIGDDLTNIDAVAADILDDDSAIDAVAANITNVNAVAANETNINAVNTNKTNINTVAGKATEITTVAGIASDVSAVAAIASDIAAVEDIDDDVSAVAAIAVDVGVVADAATDIAAVADGITDVGTVATNISDVGAVASDITKIAAVADDLTNIDAVADDLTNIDAAEANALKAEGYAVGTQNGTPVSGDSPYYENNAKFYGAALPGLQGQVVNLKGEVENINAILEGEADVTNTDPAEGESELSNSRLIHHANLLPTGALKKVGARAVAWNQLVDPSNLRSRNDYGVVITANADGSITVSGTANASTNLDFSTNNFGTVGHSYVLYGGKSSASIVINDGTRVGVDSGSGAVLMNTTGTIKLQFPIINGTTYNVTLYPCVTDLTAMNMASLTADQFRSKFPASYYPTDTGHIYDLNPTGFRIRGINLWDEVTEIGNIDASTGQNDDTVDTLIRSKNYYEVSATDYYALLAGKNARIFFYDANKTYLSYYDRSRDGSFTVPSGACYIRFRMNTAYGTTYNHDIQICNNSLPTAVKQTYHGADHHTVYTPQIADGHYVNEDCYDYVENVTEDGVQKGKKHTVVGNKLITDLTFTKAGGIFYALLPDAKPVASSYDVANICCGKFVPTSRNGMTAKGQFSISSSGSTIYINFYWDDISTADFLTAMDGVNFYYELAEEVITDVDPIRSFPVTDYCTIEPITPQTELPNRADVPFVVETKSNNGIIEQITTNKNNIEAEVATREAQVVKLQKQIDNLNQGAGGYPEITYPDATYGTGEVPPNKAKNAQVVNLIMNSRVKNQLFPSISTQTSGAVTFTNNGDGSYTITGTTTSAVYIFATFNGVGSHTYLMYGGVASKVSLYATFEGTNVDVTDSVFSGTNNSKVLSGIAIQIKGGIDFGAGLTIRPILSDLNIHFGGTVPSDASTIADIQTNYPELLIPSDYDTGTRVDTTYSAVKAWARNLWNEEWEVGAWNLTTGEKANSSTNIRCKNKIAVKPLTTYFFMASKIYYALFYDANDNFIGKLGANGWQNGNTTFETPANCAYVAFYMYDTYGTTYGHDICINKSDSQNGTYTPWHAPKTLTLPEPVTGKSAGSVHQIYYPETGEMTEPLGEYTITGDESFSETGGSQWIWQGFPNTAKAPATNTEKANMLCEFAVVDTYNNANVSGKTGMIALRDNGWLLVTTDIKNNWANLVGQKIIFELATPDPNSQATDPVIVDMIETEGGGRIEAVQTQETKIDSSFTIGYMNI